MPANGGDILMLEPYGGSWPLALEHEKLTEALTRKCRAQLKGHGKVLQAARDIIERCLIAIGEALDQTGIAEKSLPAILIMKSVFRLAARRTDLSVRAPKLESALVSEKRIGLSRSPRRRAMGVE
jgi:hypothetical protein